MTTVNLRGEPIEPKAYEPTFIGVLTAYITGPKPCRDAAVAQIAKVCGGATVSPSTGYWTDPADGVEHTEVCSRLEAAFQTGDQYAQAMVILHDCAKRGKQACVLHSVQFCGDSFGVVVEDVK